MEFLRYGSNDSEGLFSVPWLAFNSPSRRHEPFLSRQRYLPDDSSDSSDESNERVRYCGCPECLQTNGRQRAYGNRQGNRPQPQTSSRRLHNLSKRGGKGTAPRDAQSVAVKVQRSPRPVKGPVSSRPFVSQVVGEGRSQQGLQSCVLAPASAENHQTGRETSPCSVPAQVHSHVTDGTCIDSSSHSSSENAQASLSGGDSTPLSQVLTTSPEHPDEQQSHDGCGGDHMERDSDMAMNSKPENHTENQIKSQDEDGSEGVEGDMQQQENESEVHIDEDGTQEIHGDEQQVETNEEILMDSLASDDDEDKVFDKLNEIMSVVGDAGKHRATIAALAGGKTDRQYLAVEDSLMKALLALDCIESGVHREVRFARKAAVKYVQQLLGQLEECGSCS